jgi:hypothetical protein
LEVIIDVLTTMNQNMHHFEDCLSALSKRVGNLEVHALGRKEQP